MNFSIRDLLLVTVIVALAVGWWLDRSRLASENRRLMIKTVRPYYTAGPSPDFLSPRYSAPAPNPPKP